ncbi:MAG: RHS repeat domain-containing protein [Thermomicrobiales bacterium]
MTGYAHDANHRMRTSPGHTVDYDEDGNTKVRDPGVAGQATYMWDLDNRLTGYASGATTAGYAQDPFARRLKKTVGATTTWYLWAGNRLLAEYGGTGTRTARYTQLDSFAPAQMAVPNGGSEQIYTLHSDRLSTPRMMTDAASNAVWLAAYEAFGNGHLSTALAEPLNIRLPGQYFDAETRTHENRHRTYDPSAGRYLSMEPAFMSDGSSLFGYVRNSPTRFVDPLGLYREDVHYSLTRDLAVEAGFSRAYADALGSFNDSMDIAEEDQPLLNPSKHFRDREAVEQEVDDAIRRCSLRDFGRAMHAYQDSWSHGGKGYSLATLGHLPASALISMVNLIPLVQIDDPDDYTPNVDQDSYDPDDVRMTDSSFEKIRDFAENCPCNTR